MGENDPHPEREGGSSGYCTRQGGGEVFATVVNCWLRQGIILHYALYGLRGGQGTGTATLDSKLSQQLAVLAHNPLFQLFLDIRKAYDSLDRDICLEVV